MTKARDLANIGADTADLATDAEVALKAPINNPTFTGTVTADGLTTTNSSNNTTLRSEGRVEIVNPLYSSGNFPWRLKDNGGSFQINYYQQSNQFVIKDNGKVGIGASSPNDTLDVNGGNIVNPNSTGSEITSATIGLGSNIHLEERQPNGAYSDRTDLAVVTNTGYGAGESEKIRITASGNLLVGTTTVGIAETTEQGINILGQYGAIEASRSNNSSLFLNRTSSDGEIVKFRKDGVLIGSIGVAYSGADFYIGSPTHENGILFNGNGAIPFNPDTNLATNGLMDIGQDSNKFRDLYLSSTAKAADFEASGGGTKGFYFQASGSVADVANMFCPGGNTLAFGTNNQRRVTIDTNGHVMVTKTELDATAVGIELRQTGRMGATFNNGNPVFFNRLNGNGEIIRLLRDASIAGTIGTNSTGDMYVQGSNGSTYIGNAGTNIQFLDSFGSGTPRIRPTVDDSANLGDSGLRFKDLYLSGNLIGNTNDATKIFGTDILYTSVNARLEATAEDFYTNSQGLLTTGTYILQVYVTGSGLWYSETWSGIMQWYSGTTNHPHSTDIYMTGMGHANTSGREVYARVLRKYGNTNEHSIQLWSNVASVGDHQITISVKRLM